MGIRFRCHHCEHELNLKDFQGGRRARCPVCSGRFRVPTTSSDFSTPLEGDEQELAPLTSLKDIQPSTGQPSINQPSANQPSANQPSANQPSANQPSANQPSTQPPESASRGGGEQPQAVEPHSVQLGTASQRFELKQPTGDPERWEPRAKTDRPAKSAKPARPGAQKPASAAGKLGAKGVTKQPRPTADSLAPSRTTHAGAQLPSAAPAESRSAAESAAAAKHTADSAIPGVAGAASAATHIPRAIIEAPQAVWYVRPPSGGQFGPADSATFYQWMQENRVAREALVWRDGWPQWLVAAEAFEDYFGSKWLVGETAAEPAGPGVAAGSSDTGLGGVAIAGLASSAEPTVDSGLALGASDGASVATQAVASGSPVRPLSRRKRRQTNYALWISVLAIVALALVAVLVAVLMSN